MEKDGRLFIDMDGTLANFRYVETMETLFERGYFQNLEPQWNVLEAVRKIIHSHPEIPVYIMSSVLSDSKYALQEKNEWLDRYLPEIDSEHRIFLKCGENKLDYAPNGIKPEDCLLDDYTQNLILWEPPAKGIKLLNGINHTHETWNGNMLRYDKEPEELVQNILNVITKKVLIQDERPLKQKISLANQLYEQKVKTGYVSLETKSRLEFLTKAQALEALQEGIHICCVNEFPEYHGSHADEYYITELKGEPGVQNLYKTFGTGIVHKACISPYYKKPEELKKLLQDKVKLVREKPEETKQELRKEKKL